MSDCQILSLSLEHGLATFTRAMGVLRRRNLAVRSITLEPGDAAELAVLTILLESDAATARRLALQLEK